MAVLDTRGPGDLSNLVGALSGPLTPQEITIALSNADATDPGRFAFHRALLAWDNVAQLYLADGATECEPRTRARRAQVLTSLGFDDADAATLDAAFRLASDDLVVVSDEWDRWYEDERPTDLIDFYWPKYRDLLESKHWTAEALGDLDASSTAIVERLAKPWREEAYQSKGLVVGRVQSGKTANYTAVIAKAIDAGYRLVIVLTGTIDILRAQTQRRLDMELVGRENIVGGVPDSLLSELDYQQDKDWVERNFVEYGLNPADIGVPEIRRLTRHKWDYKRLQSGLPTLDYTKDPIDRQLPLFDSKNLSKSSVRLMVVKKNGAILDRLIKDLRSIQAPLSEIPALIIDDESDLASVDTTAPTARWDQGQRKRTKINGKISELLRIMKRAQYIGYTATPFANVFIDPDDIADLYPKDYIVSLPTPNNYCGPSTFHDLELDRTIQSDWTVASSNELAFVRNASSDSTGEEAEQIQRAIDSYVLSGAIKLFRQSAGILNARHHTLLVHVAVLQVAHENIATQWDSAWKASSYHLEGGLKRLRTLWNEDFLPVAVARGGMVPNSFDDLIGPIGDVVGRVSGAGTSAVIVVNGNKDSDYIQEGVRFDVDDVWKILVGGAKLSRGFTVEGLTVSYYRRGAGQEDTLLQMGRWFGYHDGYADLVRLFIGRDEVIANRTVDLYTAFEAVVRDEESFRSQLEMYSMPRDGTPPLRPWEIPPLVSQALPWLRPTARNKMFNARLVSNGSPGHLQDYNQHAPRGNGELNEANFALFSPFLTQLGKPQDFKYLDGGVLRNFQARVAIFSASELLDLVSRFQLDSSVDKGPQVEYLNRLIRNNELSKWVLLVPELETLPRTRIGDVGEFPIMTRSRRADRAGFSGSSFRQRYAVEMIAGSKFDYEDSNASVLGAGGATAAMLLTFAASTAGDVSDPSLLGDPASPRDVASLFSLATPKSVHRTPLVQFKAEKSGDTSPVVAKT